MVLKVMPCHQGSKQGGLFIPAFAVNPWLITLGLLQPDGQKLRQDTIQLAPPCAEKTHGVFKSVNKDRRPDTLVEKKYQVIIIIEPPPSNVVVDTHEKVFSDFRKAGMWVKSTGSTGRATEPSTTSTVIATWASGGATSRRVKVPTTTQTETGRPTGRERNNTSDSWSGLRAPCPEGSTRGRACSTTVP